MNEARAAARAGCPEYTVIVADRQTSGRGRLARRWLSAPGGVYFTIVLRPKIPPGGAFLVHFAAACALADMLKSVYRVEPALKWPNDVLIKGGKVCGMLSEIAAGDDRIRYINLGVGVNATTPPVDLPPEATSIAAHAAVPVDRTTVLAEVLNRLQERMTSDRLKNAVSEWKRIAAFRNRHVRIETSKETLRGIASDVDETDGALILSLDHGGRRRIVYGDCFPVAPETP